MFRFPVSYRMLTEAELSLQPTCQETLVNRLPCNRKATRIVNPNKTLCEAHFQMLLSMVSSSPGYEVTDLDNNVGTTAEPVVDMMIRETAEGNKNDSGKT